MCDITDPCCISSPVASKAACMAKGGQISTDPCNILNPVADKTICAAKSTGQAINTATGGTARGWLLFIGVLFGGILLLIILSFLVFGAIGATASMTGSGRGGMFTKVMKMFK